MERLWLLAKIGETFHVLPSVVARALDEDPERTDLTAATLLGYAAVKRQYDLAKGDDAKTSHLDEDTVARVRMNQFIGAKEKRRHAAEHRDERDLDGCRFCRKEYSDGR